MRITLSSMQYTMLRIAKQEKYFTREAAGLYRQPTFSSLVRRGYLTAEAPHQGNGDVGFKVTPAAAAALTQFDNEDVFRKAASTNLSQFLERYVKRSERRRAS